MSRWSPILSFGRAQRLRDDADAVLVRPLGDDGALLVEHFLEDHDLALDLVARGLHHVEALVQDQLLTGLDVFRLDRGVQVDLHLAALRQDVDRAVLVDREVDPVGRGGRAELVHLFLQRGDLLARLVERVDELLVLVERLDELAIGLAQLVLQDHELLRRVLQLLAQPARLGLERADVGLEVLDLDLVLRETPPIVRVGHGEEFREALHPFGRGLSARIALLVELLHVRPFPFRVNQRALPALRRAPPKASER